MKEFSAFKNLLKCIISGYFAAGDTFASIRPNKKKFPAALTIYAVLEEQTRSLQVFNKLLIDN
jgi:hypothetical protein